MLATAPFEQTTLKNSHYAKFHKGLLEYIHQTTIPDPKHQHFAGVMKSLVETATFPCLGAKSTFKTENMRFSFYKDLGCPEQAKKLAQDLYYYIEDKKQIADGSAFTSFAAIFEGPYFPDFDSFEKAYFAFLYQLHMIDKDVSPWVEGVPKDPNDSKFAFSFGGKAFFVTGMAPVIPRISRRFIVPAMVFNAHENFAMLKEQGIFQKIKPKIRAGDMMLEQNGHYVNGGVGEGAEAAQYCGNPIGRTEFKCPFHPLKSDTKNIKKSGEFLD